MSPQVPSDPCACNATNLSGNLLNCDHQWEAEDECPGQAVTEFRPYLTVCSYPTGIVISCARDETRPK